jgi:mono/diheme cytochrome c family protein/plastocyanin
MKRAEILSRVFIIAGVFLAIGVPLVLWQRTPLIHVSMAEEGGWTPNALRAEIGKPLELHLISDDVMHGFAVGQMDMGPVDVAPGKVTDVTLTFDKPGIYTFFCTRWCGLNHWRMRGTIEVSGAVSDVPTPAVPLYVSLGIDIDAPHESPEVPSSKPSALNGQKYLTDLSLDSMSSPDFYRTHSPYHLFEELKPTSLSDAQKWDVVPAVWQSNTSSTSLENGKQLYAQNCAACHGENGAGDGVFADDLAASGEASMQTMSGSTDSMQQTPANFTDPNRMLGASPALLQGKILRGGMGTGMPMWGSIFTEQQIWDLVSYLYSFQFEYDK